MDGGLQPAFSPDGDKIAYVKEKPVKTDIRKSDVWVLPIKGGPAVQVSDLPGRATRPIWSPDGKMIAFTRKAERGDNSKEICIAQVSESDNVGMTLTQIELPLETWDFLAGWTPDNKIGLLLTNPEHHAIYTVSTTGGKATQVAHQGETYHPSWSPDGERIYFRWMHGDIAYVPSDGGKISKGILDSDSIFVSLPGGGNVISPDGEKIVFSGYKIIYKDEKRDYEVDLYTMPAKGGKPTKITVSPGQDRFPCWSPDGKSIVFIRYPEPNKIKEVCIVPTQGGEVRKLTSESDSVKWSDVAWSPDGKLFAYFTEDKFIKVIPVQGGESRIVVKVEDVSMHNEMAWSRDEEELVYSSEGKLYVVSIDNGKPEEIKTGLDGWASHVSLSPDGKKIAFTASKGGDAEFWFMDDFLPLEKLAAKEKPKSSIDQKGMTIKQVWAGPDVNIAGEISPDGKYLSCTEYKTSGDLSIREIVTGKKRHLTSEADWTNFEIAHSSRWSPDGRKLVYAWSIGNGNELRLIGLDGSKPRILYKNKELNCNPQDWTPDGKKILATFSGNDENFQIGLISVADGSVRILKTLDKPHFPHTSVSLDGRNVVYDFPPKEGSWERDIFLISIDGKREIPLIKHDADDRLIDWTPDGKSILFISDRTGTYDMWRIHVADGNPQADPELIKKDIGDIQPMGFTQQGSFYYGTHLNTMDVFTAKLDLEKSVILSPPKEITQRFIGSNLTPDWSPDGEYLAYMSIRDTEQKGSNTFVLSIRSEQTGQVREIYPQIEGSWLLRWSPDGQSIFIATAPKMWAQGLSRIDIQNGDMTPVAQSEPGSIIKIFTFSPNGKFVYYVYYQWKKKVTSIISHELKTGKEKKVYYRDKEAFSDIRGLLVSPDGQYLSIGPEESEDNHLIKIIPIDGGEPKNLFIMKSDHPGQSGEYVWIPNGKEILFVKEISIMDKKMWELWQVPVNGGESRKIGLSKKRMIVPSFHPDGKRITFFTFKSSEEVWVIENFLPEKQDRR